MNRVRTSPPTWDHELKPAHESPTHGQKATGWPRLLRLTLLGVFGLACSVDTVGAEATVLKLSYSQTKQFDFSWELVAADFYQLYESPELGEPFAQVNENIDAQSSSVSLTVPLHLRPRASYFLRACGAMGCTDSDVVTVTGSMAEAIGYFKATNTERGYKLGGGDQFGYSVALSADGDTLAVGAPFEDGGNGIDGDQEDDSAINSGAVYVLSLIHI